MDGIFASNYVVQEDHGLVLDAAASERFKSLVRLVSSICRPRQSVADTSHAGPVIHIYCYGHVYHAAARGGRLPVNAMQ